MPVSARVLLLVGDTFTYRNLSGFKRLAPLYSSLCFSRRLSYESGPLTLESLGFRNNVRDLGVTKGNQINHGVSAIDVPKSGEKRVNPGEIRAVLKNETLGVEEMNPSGKVETNRDDESFKLERRISSVEVPRKSEKRVNPSEIKAVLKNETLGVDTLTPSGKVETSWDDENFELEHGISNVEVPRKREKRIISREIKTVKKKDKVDLGSLAPFAAQSFSELGLPPFLIERLEKEGFKTPTDVQAAAIPTILKNHDVVIQSYTGSGKTLAYVLPILSELGSSRKDSDANKDTGIEAVIVAPSRELAMQIVREVEKLLGLTDKRLVQQLVGGANKSRQEEGLKKNKPLIVVGTPGRIAEMSARGKLQTHNSRFLILDEVDELLAFNFREDMHRILEHVGRKSGAGPNVKSGAKAKHRQTVMVSATVPFSVIRAAQSWGNDPLLVQAKSVTSLESNPPPASINLRGDSTPGSTSQTQAPIQSLPPSLVHYYSVTRIQHKVDALRRCVHALEAQSVIAFMNQTKQLKDAVYKLEARGMNAAELHGDLNKLARSTILKKFKKGEVRVLLTNELSARGLDVPECDLVVNLGLPTDPIHYAHRAGRTGRLGRRGTVVTICEESEVFVVRKIQKQLGVVIQSCDFTEGKLVVNKDEKAMGV